MACRSKRSVALFTGSIFGFPWDISSSVGCTQVPNRFFRASLVPSAIFCFSVVSRSDNDTVFSFNSSLIFWSSRFFRSFSFLMSSCLLFDSSSCRLSLFTIKLFSISCSKLAFVCFGDDGSVSAWVGLFFMSESLVIRLLSSFSKGANLA